MRLEYTNVGLNLTASKDLLTLSTNVNIFPTIQQLVLCNSDILLTYDGKKIKISTELRDVDINVMCEQAFRLSSFETITLCVNKS